MPLRSHEAGITGTETGVRKVAIYLLFLQISHVPLAMVPTVRDQLDSLQHIFLPLLRVQRFAHSRDGRLEQAVLLGVAIRLGVDYHLVLPIDTGYTYVALNHTAARLHLGAFVVRNIALDGFATCSDLVFVLGQEIPNLTAGLTQRFQLPLLPLPPVLAPLPLVRISVLLQNMPDHPVHLLTLF